MNYIRIRFRLFVPSLTGIMIPKPIQKAIPNRTLPFDDSGLQRSDHVRTRTFEDHETARKIFDCKTPDFSDAVRVLVESRIKLRRF
ncbi:MAG TPA: hypothetical protein PLR25_13520 [Planctomycetaceae bacterium]|nr:hypothetical protein [Planctomycetaceae bacterium]